MPDDLRVVDPVHAELRALEAALVGLQARVARLESRQATRRLSPDDAARLQRLLVAISEACGSSCWNLPDLAALSLVPGNDALAFALATIVGDAPTLRGAGRFLRRACGHVVDELVLERVGAARDGAVYVVRVSGPA